MLWKTLKDDYGLDADALFRAAELDPHQLHNPAHRYPDDKMRKAWLMALEKTGDECIGLNVAKQIHPTSLHALGFAWWSSSTLCDALQRLVRFYRIVTDVQKLELEEHPGHYCLRLIQVSHFSGVIDQAYDAFFAALLIMCQAIRGEHYRPLRMNMTRSAPVCADKMQAWFGLPLHFSSEHNEVWFDKASIYETLPTGNAELAREHDQIMMRYLADLDKKDIVMQVKTRLIERLPAGNIYENDIANLLHMSRRTLQRKLSDKNKNFTALLDETRRQLAIEYVRDANTSLSEATFLLGYSEPANFTRAFKRWTGQTPSDFRKSEYSAK